MVLSRRLADRELVVSDACPKAINRYLEARQLDPPTEDSLFIGVRGERLKLRLEGPRCDRYRPGPIA
jgi:hypothetical protein